MQTLTDDPPQVEIARPQTAWNGLSVSSTPSLGDKIQRLGNRNPSFLHALEQIVDDLLRETVAAE